MSEVNFNDNHADLDNALASIQTQVAPIVKKASSKQFGEWNTVAFNASNFSAANNATWTVTAINQITYEYTIIGKTIILIFDIQNSNITIGGVLQIAIPPGFTISKNTRTTFIYRNGGTAYGIGFMIAPAGGTSIMLFSTVAGAGFIPTTANDINVGGTIIFEVQ